MGPRQSTPWSNRWLVVALTSLAVSLFSLPSLAASAGLWGLGFGYGIALPSTSSTSLTFQLAATRRFSPAFLLELGLLHYGVDANLTSGTTQVEVSSSQTYIGLKPAYTIQGVGLWSFGMKIGTASTSITSTATNGTTTLNIDTSHSNLFLAPTITLDIPTGAVTLGGELSYLMGLGDNPPSGLTLLGQVKFWF